MNLRKYFTLPSLVGLAGCLSLGVLIGYGISHSDQQIGVIGIAVGVVWLFTLVASYIGMRQRPRRFRFGLGLITLDHIWVELTESEAQEEWSTLDGQLGRLVEAARCRHCSIKRFFVVTNDDRTCYVSVDYPTGPWGRWSVGLMFGFAKDPPRAFPEPTDHGKPNTMSLD